MRTLPPGADRSRMSTLADIAAMSALKRKRAKENTMTERVSWVNELAVKAGKHQTFKELMEEMVSGARNQPGTLANEWDISPDGGTAHVGETYADSAAAGPPPPTHGVAVSDRG